MISDYRIVLLATAFLGISVIVNAQKLPEIQKNSLRAPSGIKTDGKPTEWDNKFGAYNKSTGVYYTIANDNNKLYLTLQTADPKIIKKIIAGGITFTVNGNGKMKDKDGMSVTFPAYAGKETPVYINKGYIPAVSTTTPQGKTLADSFMNAFNKQLTARFKIIGVAGLKTIPDSVLSIYNEQGIKAVALLITKCDTRMSWLSRFNA